MSLTNARTSILTICFFTLSKLIAAQSDDCNSPSTLTPGSSCVNTSGTLYNATSSGITGACAGTKYDVWYTFTTPAGCNSINIDMAAISAGGNNLDATNTFMEVFNGTNCGTTSLSPCTPIGTTLTLAVGPSTPYRLRLFTLNVNPNTNGTSRWDYNVCISYVPPPANDDCSGAITLGSGTSCSNTAGSVVNATSSAGLPAGCETAGTHYEVWYKFVATNNTHTATVSGRGSNFTSPQVQLYSGACGSLTSIACGTTSVSSAALNIGITYHIRVSNIGSSPATNGGFDICITNPTPPVVVVGGRMKEVYQQTILSGSGALQYPWEITYGPDNNLWITEARGYKVYKMDPNTGAKTTVLDISMGSTWLPSPSDSLNVQFNSGWPQGGMAGLALHPKFLDGSGNDYVYVSYVHRNLGGTSPSGMFFRNKLVRFTYNSGTQRLESPVVLCDTLPGSNDHNSQRIIIAPVTPGGTNYLFYASGDMGSGRFGNRTRAQKAQIPASYEGKILRFNLVTDGEAAGDAWIPNDNPYSITSAVWSIGMRNNQGFAYNPDLNILYGSAHGAYSDDEINVIEPFKNYGHPLIIGYNDGNYNGNTVQGTNTSISAGAPWTDASGISSCPPIGNENTNKATIDASGNGLYKEPLFSAYNASQASITSIWQTNPGNGGWPSEGWSGLDLYTNKLIPGWKNSLVAASLKWGRLVRLKLNGTGTATAPNNSASDTISYFNSQNRFRDIAFAPNGKDIFVVMDNSSTTSGPGSANPVVPGCAGCVQKYTFLGYNDAGGKSSIPTSIDVADGASGCNTGTTVTIDNTNNNYWVPITGPDGNIMAEIFANGNNLGTVTSSFYKNTGSIRISNTTHYLDRNITITPQNQPSSAVKIRLYLSKAELDALIADAGSGVFNVSNLQILKNNDPCSATVIEATTAIPPTFAEAHGANGHMLQADITSFSSFYFASSNFTLPLDLLTFTGHLQTNNSVLLNWKTENEINTSHFVIERSTDGNRFSSLGNVTANGRNNTGGSFSYSFTDNDAINQSSQRLYYRLKMLDINGSYEYSNIVTVSLPLITGKMAISPNPVVNEVKVMLASADKGKIEWKMIDNVGRTILKGTEQVNTGANNFTINMNRLPSGTYYLTVTGAGNDQRVKLQKL